MANLREIAIETMAAVQGAEMRLKGLIDRAVAGTEMIEEVEGRGSRVEGFGGRIEVTGETTAAAARRLAEQGKQVAALNFASATNPGGGFIGGAKAQEEDLCRCSALYACLVTQPEYYRRGRAEGVGLYPDLCLWSPEVPFLRDDDYAWLAQPFLCSILTAAAPNANRVLQVRPEAEREVRATLERRAEMLLSVFAAKGARHVILGAWGCGAFGNDPVHTAETFARLVPRFPFDHVVFAVYDRTKTRANRRAFRDRLDPSAILD